MRADCRAGATMASWALAKHPNAGVGRTDRAPYGGADDQG